MHRLRITAGAIVSVMMSSAALAQSSPCAALPVGTPPYAQMPYQTAPATMVAPSPMNEAAGSRQTPPAPPSAADLPISKESNKGSANLELKPLPCSTGQSN
jgi:hypothetical protein